MLFQPRNPRRGVLLLVVMALLALMATVTMTFVLVSGVQMRSARGTALADLDTNTHEALLDGAMDQLLRGADNYTSPIGAHSLLEDVYGLDGRLNGMGGDAIYGPLKGTLDADATYYPIPGTSPQQHNGDIVEFTFTLDTPPPEVAQLGFFDGRLITMLDGNGRGVTRRILRYVEPTGTPYGKLHVKSFGGDLPKQGEQFLINDRPFSGTGFGLGYETAPAIGSTIDHKFTGAEFPGGWERALLPNHSTIAIDFGDLGTNEYPNVAGVGGADEDYDAPDYQNEFMAMMIVDKATGTYVVKPSFHDPALINYWENRIATDTDLQTAATMNPEYIRDLKRKMSFRPFSEDHPGFPSLPDPVNGPWEVDNDGNGREDSVWIDLGSRVQTDASGRQFKPMYAILCVDLDGRINLNAHGSPMHLVRNSANWPKARFIGPFADKSGEALLPVGQGYGPADVMLNHIFETGTTTAYQPDDLYYLLHGRQVGGVSVAGRYGEPSLLPGFSLTSGVTNIPMPGLTTLWDATTNAGDWGRATDDDDLDGDSGNITERYLSQQSGTVRDDNFPPSPTKRLDLVEVPSLIDNLGDFRGNAMATGLGADLNSSGAVVSDLRGTPIYISHGDGADAIDDPYEIDLTRTNSQQRREAVNATGKLAEADAPFKPSDLEVLLRINDADVGTLYSRLLELAGDTFLNSASAEFKRAIVTTESWDSPTVASMLGLPEESGSPFDFRAEQLLVARLKGGPSAHTGPFKEELREGLAPELLDGLKLDLNRPFGNSVDDDEADPTAPGYGVIDEPGDGAAAETLWDDPAIGGVLFDYDNNGKVDDMDRAARIKEANLARQVFARHLYILAMALRNENAPLVHATPGDQIVTAREVAQWCINVVDFRDSDSIMTAFEYDPDPFDDDGWSVDGNITTDEIPGQEVVVWGVERPELLITETLAGHDRGTDDTSEDGLTTDAPTPDVDYDQVARPDGWVAIELFNPQSEALPKPAELYDDDGLELSATAGTSPVWRLAFGKPEDPAVHPQFDDADANRFDMRHEPVLKNSMGEAGATGNIERTVYFTTTAPGIGDAGVEYYRKSTGMEDKVCIGPNRYAVIGSQGVDENGTPVDDITIGRHYNGGAGQPKINLGVAGTPLTGEPNFLHTQDDGMTPAGYPKYQGSPDGNPATGDESIRAPIAVRIDEPYLSNTVVGQRMSISEPVDGYNKDASVFPGTTADQVWDQNTEPWVDQASASPEYGTVGLGAYNRVYLQRLANPTLAYDSDTNPYLTVDSMPIDLWVYNSSAAEAAANVMPAAASEEPGDIRSRERIGDAPDADSTDPNTNIWRQWAGDETPGALPNPGNALEHTFGYLNSVWHQGAAADHRWWTPKKFQTDHTQALASGVYSFSGADEDFYTGAPLTPAPWLAWHNRPYMSKYELMMVPKSSPAELLAEFSVRNPAVNPYKNPTPESEFSGHYDGNAVSHLLNFFHASDENGDTTNANDLYRIFEFVDVPSRFSGLEELLDPKTFNAATGTSASPNFGWDNSVTPSLRSFAPPFNYRSTFREPGKININTIFEFTPFTGAGKGDIWTAILGGYDSYSDSEVESQWWRVIHSRRGYGGLTDVAKIDYMDPKYPTLIARPFRSFSGGAFVPLTSLKHSGIEATLLRPSPSVGNAAIPDPEFKPLLGVDSTVANTDTSKNPYFRYQLINRLSNMVTTRSNVYAVWITVGYFEVEPIDRSDYLAPTGNYTNEEIDRVFPDGFRLKGELGADTGEIERHRAFYMVDRLVPVAFERGKTHNTRKTIRLRTMIE